MNYAIILSGGIGSRMKNIDVPKQYMYIDQKMIIEFSLTIFQENNMIDKIVIVASQEWHHKINGVIKNNNITKFLGYADSGETRQESIYSGLKVIEPYSNQNSNIIIHDAARPLVSDKLITDCLTNLKYSDAVMPVLPIKDTCYESSDGKNICGFIPRSNLFAGQAPEAFRFTPYFNIHKAMDIKDLKQISGSSEIAYKNGLNVKLIDGDEKNMKITTMDDILLLKRYLDIEV